MNVTEMARAALCEAGRPDLAPMLLPNRAGDPVVGLLGFLSPDDLDVVMKACRLAHEHVGNDFGGTTQYVVRHGSWRTIVHDTTSRWHRPLLALIEQYRMKGRTDD